MRPLIIAHRGASGYLPEHTLPAKALAYAMGADYLEQDVVATRDDALVVLHDVQIDRVSDVASKFPERARQDRRYYVRDFDLEELRTLRLSERVNADGTAVYPGRFPVGRGNFTIHTLAEEIELVQGLNAATGRTVGIYPEIKRPAWHRDEGIDITPLLLEELERHGYTDRSDSVFVQCFDKDELARIRGELGSPLRLVQLIGENAWRESKTDYDALRTRAGLRRLADTVDAVGPWLPQLYALDAATGNPTPGRFVADAHDAGLDVHTYTLREDELPDGFRAYSDLVRFSAEELRVDGLFTDFPDVTRRWIDAELPTAQVTRS